MYDSGFPVCSQMAFEQAAVEKRKYESMWESCDECLATEKPIQYLSRQPQLWSPSSLTFHDFHFLVSQIHVGG